MKSSTIATLLAMGLLAMTILNSCTSATAEGAPVLIKDCTPTLNTRDVYFRAIPIHSPSTVVIVKADSAFQPQDIVVLDEDNEVCIISRCN